MKSESDNTRNLPHEGRKFVRICSIALDSGCDFCCDDLAAKKGKTTQQNAASAAFRHFLRCSCKTFYFFAFTSKATVRNNQEMGVATLHCLPFCLSSGVRGGGSFPFFRVCVFGYFFVDNLCRIMNHLITFLRRYRLSILR